MTGKIVLIGSGGHCVSCLDVIEQENKFSIAGIVDKPAWNSKKTVPYPIIGSDEDFPELAAQYGNFLIAVGFIKNPDIRISLFRRIKELNGNFPVIISPLAYISKHSLTGEGTIVMHNAVINAQAETGVNCIINTGCLIEHNSVIGDHCHISTQSVINGNCRIGSRVFIGSGCRISNGITITDDVIIGIGSVVIQDIKEKGTYAGNPLRKIN